MTPDLLGLQPLPLRHRPPAVQSVTGPQDVSLGTWTWARDNGGCKSGFHPGQQSAALTVPGSVGSVLAQAGDCSLTLAADAEASACIRALRPGAGVLRLQLLQTFAVSTDAGANDIQGRPGWFTRDVFATHQDFVCRHDASGICSFSL